MSWHSASTSMAIAAAAVGAAVTLVAHLRAQKLAKAEANQAAVDAACDVAKSLAGNCEQPLVDDVLECVTEYVTRAIGNAASADGSRSSCTPGLDSNAAAALDATIPATREPSEQPADDQEGHVFEIDPSSLSVDDSRVIGKGGSSIVYEGRLLCAGTSLPVAVKRLTVASTEEQQVLRKELKLLSLATSLCTRTCRLLGVCTLHDRVCIVTRLYRCSLASALLEAPERKLSLSRSLEFAVELCAALVELHKVHIVHQDLKPSNLLLDHFDSLVIADFGISHCLSTICSRCLPSHAAGTPHYMAPEAFDPAEYGGITAAADIWSMACCVLQMVQGSLPWEGLRPQQISRQVCDKHCIPHIDPAVSAPLASLLLACFRAPSSRPTAAEAHTHLVYLKSQHFMSQWCLDYDDPSCSLPSSGTLRPTSTAALLPTWLRDASEILGNNSPEVEPQTDSNEVVSTGQPTWLRDAEKIQNLQIAAAEEQQAAATAVQQAAGMGQQVAATTGQDVAAAAQVAAAALGQQSAASGYHVRKTAMPRASCIAAAHGLNTSQQQMVELQMQLDQLRMEKAAAEEAMIAAQEKAAAAEAKVAAVEAKDKPSSDESEM